MRRTDPAFLSLISCLLLAGCSTPCPPPPEVERLAGQSLGEPDAALYYFKEAMIRTTPDAAWHQYLCFSQAMKVRFKEKYQNEFSMENYLHVRDDVRKAVEDRAGALAQVEIGKPVYNKQSPHLAEVELRGGGRAATIQLTLEHTWFVRWKDPLTPVAEYTLPFGAEPCRLSGQELLLRLPAQQLPSVSKAADIHRVTYDRSWKILGLKDDPDWAADINQMLKKKAPGT